MIKVHDDLEASSIGGLQQVPRENRMDIDLYGIGVEDARVHWLVGLSCVFLVRNADGQQ